MLKLIFIFNVKNTGVSKELDLNDKNLDMIFKMTKKNNIGDDELEKYATDENIMNLKKVIKFIKDRRLYQTSKLRKFTIE